MDFGRFVVNGGENRHLAEPPHNLLVKVQSDPQPDGFYFIASAKSDL